jgi:hypothetical protein
VSAAQSSFYSENLSSDESGGGIPQNRTFKQIKDAMAKVGQAVDNKISKLKKKKSERKPSEKKLMGKNTGFASFFSNDPNKPKHRPSRIAEKVAK